MTVYTKIDSKLASWKVDTEDYLEALQMLRDELGATHRKAILVVIK